jgi:hypothetical protein
MVQAMWVVPERARTDTVHIAFAKALQLKTTACMRYAVTSCAKVCDLPRKMQKLNETVQELCTVTKSVDGRTAEPHVSRGTLNATQLAAFVEGVTTTAELICTTHQLDAAYKLRFVLEVVKMLYTLLKAQRNSGEPFNT